MDFVCFSRSYGRILYVRRSRRSSWIVANQYDCLIDMMGRGVFRAGLVHRLSVRSLAESGSLELVHCGVRGATLGRGFHLGGKQTDAPDLFSLVGVVRACGLPRHARCSQRMRRIVDLECSDGCGDKENRPGRAGRHEGIHAVEATGQGCHKEVAGWLRGSGLRSLASLARRSAAIEDAEPSPSASGSSYRSPLTRLSGSRSIVDSSGSSLQRIPSTFSLSFSTSQGGPT